VPGQHQRLRSAGHIEPKVIERARQQSTLVKEIVGYPVNFNTVDYFMRW
jgi:hypothetical protein